MSEWQPIETAPKDNKSILGYHPFSTGSFRILTMLWDRNYRTWRADVHSYIHFKPTHWMPIPDPPKTEE